MLMGWIMKIVTLTLLFVNLTVAESQQLPLYYGSEFLQAYQDQSLSNEVLISKLYVILSGGHLKKENAADTIFPNCNSVNTEEGTTAKCVEHRPLGYTKAREKLFGWLYLKKQTENSYSVTDVYCERTYTDADFGGEPTFGPDKVPSSGNVVNTEHTWPQSRFTGRFPRETQKSDLHHLFPTDSEMNARRGSLRFGNVLKEIEKLKCPENRIGHQEDGSIIFQVPKAQQGNTARAIFYFATRYQMKISPTEEATLRKWNDDDPVDAEEFVRNEQIESLQGNRNPYVDFADLLSHIHSFQ